MAKAVQPRIFILLDELAAFEAVEGPTAVSAGRPSNDEDQDLHTWVGTIIGPSVIVGGRNQSNFCDRIYSLKLYCSDKYPYEPPTIHFINKINLPGVDPTDGRVDPSKFNLLKEWTATGNPQQHLKFSISSALYELRTYMQRNYQLPQEEENAVYDCYKDNR
ncbi:hypothetical protein PpBr36_03859 [Pyricularia pennisetigena]|uniref:hypothetical protein n=1 Tax=Pyricularia pennisetigena TaxID=1578925 RepID=UPI00114E5CD6|nr:hypothetical protein PpBr36_03859 [Pyricularia pennisetigena]TLS30963.1 hypothetical protein PpBr36_03859 [Pyricularia pennisetigena]